MRRFRFKGGNDCPFEKDFKIEAVYHEDYKCSWWKKVGDLVKISPEYWEEVFEK